MKLKLLILAIGSASLCYAQGGALDGFSIRTGAGLTSFYGDLSEFDVIPKKPINSKTYGSAWHFTAARTVWKNIGAELKFERGELYGGRLPGAESIPVNFETDYNTFSLSANYELFGPLFNKKPVLERKLYMNARAGLGMTFYRSLSFWSNTNEIREYIGYSEPTEAVPLTRKNDVSNAKRANALLFPIGFNLAYRVSPKTDISLDLTQYHTLTDELDTWTRDWTAKDKYIYTGLSIKYNFNRTEDDYPAKKEKETAADNTGALINPGTQLPAGLGGIPQQTQAEGKNGFLSGLFKKKTVTATQSYDENMLKLMMRMFELQMKLFETQYIGEK